MKILITGGAGYIGSILTEDLLEMGHEVVVLDNFMFRQTGLLGCCAHPGFSVVRGDCRDRSIVEPLMKDADVVVPLAALVGAPMCEADKLAAKSTNVDSVRLILDLRSKDQRILFPNTNSGYGIGESGKFCTEDSPLRPITLYGKTKVEAEKAILDAGNAVCFRLATVFGMSPRMRLDLLVNDFVHRAVTDRTVVVFEGHFKRNYIHVRDVSRAFRFALEQFDGMKNDVYNVGLDDANLSKLELCARIGAQLPDFVYSEAAVGKDPDKRDYIVSNEKIARAGFVTEYTLDGGIAELVKGYSILRNSRFSNI